MAKKSPAELKAEGAELNTLLAAIRKRPHNFALQIGKEGLVLEAHPKKGADLMWRQAKANGGSPKGTQGVMTVEGKIVTLNCETEGAPANLGKLARKHFADRGLAYKVIMMMPDGSSDSDADDEESEEDIGASAPPRSEDDEAPAAPDATPPTEDGGGAGEGAGGSEADALIAKFKEHADVVQTALQSANEKAAKKIEALSDAFNSSLEGGDLAKAASTLNLLIKGATDIAKRFPPPTDVAGPIQMPESVSKFLGDVVSSVGDAIEEAGEAISDAADAISESVSETVEELTEAYDLATRGLSVGTVAGLVMENQDNPGALDAALAELDALEAAKVPPRDIEQMFQLKKSNPKSHAAAMKALTAMDADGSMDISREAIATSLKKVQEAQKDSSEKWDTVSTKESAWEEAKKKEEEAKKAYLAKKPANDRAQKAVADFKAAHPEPLSPEDQAELDRLEQEATTLAGELAPLKTAYDTAQAASTTTYQAYSDAWDAADATRGPLKDARAAQQALEDKRDLLDALSYGPLSDGAQPELDDDAKAELIGAYEKSPDLGRAALDLVSDSEDPSVIVQNVGFIGDKMQDGFADKDGKAISASAEDREIMAVNALRMGAKEGQSYFDGFKTYLESGDQRKPDPNGGDQPPESWWKDERARVAEVNTARASNTADALIDKDGKVNFETKDAKAAMDHLMYHPGSLRVPAPALIDQVRGLKENFADAETGPKMQATLDATKLPEGGSPEKDRRRKTASTIVGGTVGEDDPSKVTDADAKQAVLAAMISPMSQGPVGSCFTTAAVRKVREQDPARAMEEFSNIAQTGMFTTANGKSYPANTTPPKGENALMRSWEYSVASAASSANNSHNRQKMDSALFAPGVAGNLNALGGPDIMGDAWNDKTVDGAIEPGIRSKLRSAIDAELTFNYNAGPDLDSGGGGDGRSESGVFEVIYDRKVLTEKEDFVEAIGKIALGACGEREGTEKGDKILAIVRDPAFVDAIVKSNGGGFKPWDDAGGAYGRETTKVLEGGNPTEDVFLALETTGQDPGERTRALLDQLAGIPGTDSAGGADDRPLMWTMGSSRGANHVFALLPDDPSFKALKEGDMAANINEQLLEPGKAISETEISVSEAATMFENEVERLSRRWGLAPETTEGILEKCPDDEMTPGELKDHISSVMEEARKAEEDKQVDKWKSGFSTEPSDAAIEKKRRLIEEKTKISMTSGIDTALVDKFDPPEVVIADTNWGGPKGQKYFVIAPDPSTGDLRMWEKDSGTGKLEPADDIWADAQWAVVNE